MPSFIVLAQLYHCFLEGGGIHPPSHRKPKKPGLNRVKPDFHSRFSLVASEVFRMRHAQSGKNEENRTKNIFRSVRI